MQELKQYLLECGANNNDSCLILIRCDTDIIMVANRNEVYGDDEGEISDYLYNWFQATEISIWIVNDHRNFPLWDFIYTSGEIESKGYKSKTEAINESLKFVRLKLAAEKEECQNRIAKIELLLPKLITN